MSTSLPIKNTELRYGVIAIALHWIVAFAFIANYAIIYYRDWFLERRSEEARVFLSYHTAIGVSVLVFVALRILWKFMNRQPEDVPGSALEHFAAHAAHVLLYAAMIVIPLTGYLGTGGPSQFFFLLEVPRFADTQVFKTAVEGWMGLTWKQFEAPMDFIHKQGGAYVVSVLVAVHAGAALYHHFVRRDVVLRRMISPSLVVEKTSAQRADCPKVTIRMPRNAVVALAVALGVIAGVGGGADAHETKSRAAAYAKRLAELRIWFEPDAIVAGPTLVDCTLSGGATTRCFSITLKPRPSGLKIGPWCPRHISDGPDKAGIWLYEGKVRDADGTFIAQLKSLYKDDAWQMFDPKTGKVHVTDSKESCEAAARPDVDPRYRNHCVECRTSYMQPSATLTYVIPLESAIAANPGPRVVRVGVGLSFNGAKIEGPAPLDAILSAHTLAPFDDCGGHVNLHVGYHIHAVTGCLKKIGLRDSHGAAIGIAMDGYLLLARQTAAGIEPRDLDRCRGHTTQALGYHYHVAEPGKNAIIGCHTGQTGCAFEGGPQTCDATKPDKPGRRPPQPAE